MIYSTRRFSFLSNIFKSNKKEEIVIHEKDLREKLNSWNKKISPEVKKTISIFIKNCPKDFLEYITFIHDNFPDKDIYIPEKKMKLYSYQNIISKTKKFRKNLGGTKHILIAVDTENSSPQEESIWVYWSKPGELWLYEVKWRYDYCQGIFGLGGLSVWSGILNAII